MRKLGAFLVILFLFSSCQSTKQVASFNLTSVGDGSITLGGKAFNMREHEWKAPDGSLIDVELISFNSVKEARHYYDIMTGQKSKNSSTDEGRKIFKNTNPKTKITKYRAVLWEGSKIVQIKGSSLKQVMAFEKCCSNSEFKSIK